MYAAAKHAQSVVNMCAQASKIFTEVAAAHTLVYRLVEPVEILVTYG